MRKPARKTVARGEHPDRPDRPAPRDGRSRAADPDAAAEQLDERRVDERHAAKTCPWLKNQSETENESSTSRSRFRSESSRRQSASPRRNTAQKPSQTG